MNIKSLFHWTIILPILSTIFYFSGLLVNEGWFSAIGAMLLIGSVLSAVHHAEGSCNIKLANLSERLFCDLYYHFRGFSHYFFDDSRGEKAMTYARDTVFASNYAYPKRNYRSLYLDRRGEI